MAINLGLDIDDSQITTMLERAIEEQVQAKFTDQLFIDKIQSLVNQQVTSRLESMLDNLSINDKIEARVKGVLDNKFASIQSDTNRVQLTLMDDTVVNENEFVTNSLTVMNEARANTLTVNDLIIRGRVNTDNTSWDELKTIITEEAIGVIKRDTVNHIKERVLETAKTDGIDFQYVKIDGNTLVDGDRLGNGIIHSRLRTVGELEELEVEGHTRLNETLTVNKGKIGINTDSPATALDLRDDDIRITVGKKSKDTAQIATKNALEITTGNTAMVIEPDGKVKINDLMIGRNNISWAKQVPNFSGQKGDIVFNMDPGADSPLGWQCLGSFRWRVIEWNTAG